MEVESFQYEMIIEPLGTSVKTEDYEEVVDLEALTIRDTFTSEASVTIDDWKGYTKLDSFVKVG